ncbi:MAG TPA: sulfur oxidation c-type cytochrome SoxX [Candidatus Methylomirabilis sp.]|nr:sulfur oxidation c-type cytochrome SoxX [Candidatus Methylomirabilis sp.]
MRKMIHFVVKTGITAAVLGLGPLVMASSAHAGGGAPDPAVCENKANPPKDAVTQGGCIAITRTKGNCMACHEIAGTTYGNIAPALVNVAQRWPDKAKLRAQIYDASKANPNTVMPPFGRHQILTPDEIDKVVDFVLTL